MYKILLVDDEILVREAIRETMKWDTLGFELGGDCENGKEAIEILDSQHIDVVLTDIYMPYIDGLKLSKYIYEKKPDVNVIIFSGYNDFEYARQAIRYNVVEYILKPVTAKELSLVLKKMKEKLDDKWQEQSKYEELAKTQQTYKRNEGYIVAKLLSNLVKGSVDVATSIKGLLDVGVHLHGEAFRVGILKIEDSKVYLKDDEKRKKDSSSLSYAISNIANELMEEKEYGMAFQDADNYVNLIFFSPNAEEFNSQVYVLCKAIQDQIKKVTDNVETAIVIGTKVDNLEGLHKSYESAESTLAHPGFGEESVIVDMEQVVSSNKRHQALLAMDYLHKNYNNSELTLNTICNHLGVSTSHFSSFFKEEIGQTFSKYLNNIRIGKAKELLRETSLRNYEIAEKVGFSDPHYFSVAFKKITGKTPQKYGREHVEDGLD